MIKEGRYICPSFLFLFAFEYSWRSDYMGRKRKLTATWRANSRMKDDVEKLYEKRQRPKIYGTVPN